MDKYDALKIENQICFPLYACSREIIKSYKPFLDEIDDAVRACGAVNTGKFCAECGAKKPEDGWTCACGQVNKGKFCAECGAKKPAGVPLYKCDKCGWEPEDPANPPKFCPECGDIFDDSDVK